MELHVHLHGALAMTLQVDPREPLALRPTALIERVSARWPADVDPSVVLHWLSACLPENGALDAYIESTRNTLLAHGIPAYPRIPETVLWAHADSEYPGAVSMSRSPLQDPSLHRPLAQYPRLAMGEAGALLGEGIRMAQRGQPPRRPERHASLSGQRPKVSLSLTSEGDWCLAPPRHLNTWIVKVEDSARNPGEAGVESICQASCAAVGVAAARTTTRVLDGTQCVLSERSDRHVDADGWVRAVHQEDFRQAAGASKFPSGLPREPGWPAAYALLREHAQDAVEACDELTRLLASTWLLSHADLHRGNLGFVHAPLEQAPTMALAPVYDVSSSLGTGYPDELVFGIGGARHPRAIGAEEWRTHALDCSLDPERTLATVGALANDMPGAFESARQGAVGRDENRLQADVDARCDVVAEHISACAAHFARSWRTLRGSPAIRPT